LAALACSPGLQSGQAELFLVNDNDFGVDCFKDGAVVPNHAVTRIDRYTLPAGTVTFSR